MQPDIFIKTGLPEFDHFYPLVKSFLEKDVLETVVDGLRIRGFRSPDARSIWIRDHSDILRGAKYFETDLKSAIQHFAETQAENGRIFDYFTTFPEKLPSERENWTKYVRVPVEADVEYRFVKAAFLAWQVNGDDDWLKYLLPKMEKALNYILTHPWRWESRLGLVKRAYTIDTWDFAYTAGSHDWLQFQINDQTFWGIMHGDNSGYYEAFQRMAFFYDYLGNKTAADKWRQRAHQLRENLNRVCWNGSYYTHFIKLTPVSIAGVDECQQLSLSNPMNINRGVTDHAMAVSILKEYIKRGQQTGAFAEWFSIEPPFPDGIFGDDKLIRGAYVNGGIMPLVGGELAMAAFNHGLEKFAVDILKRYYAVASRKNETYLWYFPDGSPSSVETSTSPEATPTDGWGSSAMLYALFEGLAGVQDLLKRYHQVRISPRWAAANISEAQIRIGYQASSAFIDYTYRQKSNCLEIDFGFPGSTAQFHVLLPAAMTARSVTANAKLIHHQIEQIEDSRYANFVVADAAGFSICIHLEPINDNNMRV